MHRKTSFLLFVLLSFTFIAANLNNCFAERQKSTVLLLINNTAHSKHDKKLNTLMLETLHKKIDVIYHEENPGKFVENFYGKEQSKLSLDEMLAKLSGSTADYLVYVELKALDKDSDFNLIYYSKEVTATLFVRLIDMKNEKELYRDEFTMTSKDTTDYFFIGSGSVSKKALNSALFKAGEIISCHLPL